MKCIRFSQGSTDRSFVGPTSVLSPEINARTLPGVVPACVNYDDIARTVAVEIRYSRRSNRRIRGPEGFGPELQAFARLTEIDMALSVIAMRDDKVNQAVRVHVKG